MNRDIAQLAGLSLALSLGGCGKPDSTASSAPPTNRTDSSPAVAEIPASEKRQPSLQHDGTLGLPEATRKAFAITTTVVQRKAFSGSRLIPFQVFREADEKPLPGMLYRPGYAYAVVMLPEGQTDLRKGDRAEVALASGPRRVPAYVAEIDLLPGSANHQSEAVLEIPDKANALELSQSVAASFSTGSATNALVIPQKAVLDTASGTFAYIETSDGYKRTPIKTGSSADAEIQITDGLKAGDVIVTSPVQTLWLTELKLQSGGGE